MGSLNIEWHFNRNENYYPELKRLPSVNVFDHPLKSAGVTVIDSRLNRKGISSSTTSSTRSSTPTPTTTLELLTLDDMDPLRQFANDDTLCPLTKSSTEQWSSKDTTDSKKKNEILPEDNIEPWSVRRSEILSKFTTSEKLSIMTSFLSGGEKVVMKPQSTTIDKVKIRLEQLDEFEEGSVRHEQDLTQQEYTARIEQLNNELVAAWRGEQRVRALKIAIQCAKLLADTSVIPFYPSKFVLITDILDIFGKLVHERLRTKAEYYVPGSKVPSALPENFTPDIVPETVKETCRNWFYKISSIRELVPRLYVEMAILKSYSFLTSSEYSAALMRLTRMIRGIGHPLVAVYARCYLCRVGMTVSTPLTDRKYLAENFYDFLASYNQVFSNNIKAELQCQRVEMSGYLGLYTPALDWILQAAAATSDTHLIDRIIEQCQHQSNSGLLLNTIMISFKPNFIADRAMQLVEMITQCEDEGFPVYVLFRTLGLCLGLVAPPQDQCRIVLNTVWRVVSALTDPSHYINCAEVWVQYAVSNFSSREVNTFLNDIINHLSPNRVYENYTPQLLTILEKVVSHIQDFESLFIMDSFLPLLDFFSRENARVEACKLVMNAYATKPLIVNDPVVTNALMSICHILHDSVNALTVDDERRQIGNLINNFIKHVEHGRDFEQQLNFYVEARATFTNLDTVLTQLVQCVNRLSVETRQLVKGQHTQKTGAFVRACAAYCYITIPSIASVLIRLRLYLLSGKVALFNHCLGQADACFKVALSLLPELPRTIEIDGKQCNSEQLLIDFVQNFLSTLLVVPDSPDQSTLYLTRGLINIIQHYSWEICSTAEITIYLQVLNLLGAAVQDTYIYHVDRVDSNDSLYGSDQKFILEVNKISGNIIEKLLLHLKHLSQQNDQQRVQSTLAIKLCIIIMLRGDLSKPNITTLVVNLWQLAQKNANADIQYMNRTLAYFKQKAIKYNNQHLKDLLVNLKIDI